MLTKRTDLADEAKALFEQSAGKTTALQGVRAREYGRQDCRVTAVDVLTPQGGAALGKPVGRYRTMAVHAGREAPERFSREARCIAEELRALLPPLAGDAPVLVAGLGNRRITPDAIGPQTVEHLLITRHLRGALGPQFPALTPVCALAAGVLGETGVESAELVRGVAARVQPACVIVVDALVARRMDRLCATVQLSDTGLVPGSGVGNHRSALNRETLGVPVLSVGVPTVIEAATLAADLLEEAEAPSDAARFDRSVIVTPRDIDAQVQDLSRLVGYGINLALQSELGMADLAALLG